MKSGNKIDASGFAAAGVTADGPFLAKTAYEAMNAMYGDKGADDYIIKEMNGMKDEYGTGLSTQIQIYNALGLDLKLIENYDDHGSFFKYAPDDRIYNGEWSGLLHVHPQAAAVGSSGMLAYVLPKGAFGEDIVLMISWSNPYSGSNTCNCSFTNRSNYNRIGAANLCEALIDGGAASRISDYGILGVSYRIGKGTSPICRVVASYVSLL